MTKPVDVKLTDAERGAWDIYAARAAGAVLQNWFRWKMGVAVDRAVVISEATTIADMLIVERRAR